MASQYSVATSELPGLMQMRLLILTFLTTLVASSRQSDHLGAVELHISVAYTQLGSFVDAAAAAGRAYALGSPLDKVEEVMKRLRETENTKSSSSVKFDACTENNPEL